MLVEKKTVTVQPEAYKLELTREDAERLLALTDLPVWATQPDELYTWLTNTNRALKVALGIGYFPHTKVGFKRQERRGW